MPNPERFEIVCYHVWGGAEATYRFASKEEYEAVRRGLNDILLSRSSGRCEVTGLVSPPSDYYVIDEPDRDVFNEFMRDKGIGPDDI